VAWTVLDSGTEPFADGGAGHAFAFPAGAAAAGDLLVLAVSSDTVVSTPAGWSPAVSDVANLGAYLFYKVATGGETSTTITTSGNHPTIAGFRRYSGSTATPLDKTSAGRSIVSASTTPAATTAALAETGELAVAAACLGGMQTGTPSSPVWSAGYTGRLDAQTAGTGPTDQHLFLADNQAAGTAAQSPNVAWTPTATNNQTMLVATFLAAADTTVEPIDPAVETGTAQPVGAAKRQAVAPAGTTESAQPIGASKSAQVLTATAIETAQPVGAAKAAGIGAAQVTEIALPIGALKRHAIGPAVETEVAQTPGSRKTRAIGPAIETDQAPALTDGPQAGRGTPTLADRSSATVTGYGSGVRLR
jgi:hypothetical protein